MKFLKLLLLMTSMYCAFVFYSCKATCFDGKMNGNETDIDCGGSECDTCISRPISQEKELMILDLSVVDSEEAKTGSLSIKSVLENMTTGNISAKDLMLSILTSWEESQNINGFNVAPRTNIKDIIIDPWKNKDGFPDILNENWDMNFDNAPFRLLAVVNRIDLSKRDDNNNVLNAGEGRLVFGILNHSNQSIKEEFTWIFEYELQANNDQEVLEWAQKWHKLGEFDEFNSDYLNELISVVNSFAGRNVAPSKINGSALNQLRTNERSIGTPWELREFVLNASNGLFNETTRKMTPDISINNTSLFATFIQQNEDDILENDFSIPVTFNTQNFLSGNSPVPEDNISFVWEAPGVSQTLIRNISIGTCNGCHSGSTGTIFTHIKPRSEDQESLLSEFTKDDLVKRKQIMQRIITPSDPSISASAVKRFIAERKSRVH